MKNFKLFFWFIYLSLISSEIMACPICHTEISQQIRQGIFNHTFLINLFYILLPFLIFGLIAFFTYYGLPVVFAKKILRRRLSNEFTK